MERQHAAILALGCFVLLAGCSGGPIGLNPGVIEVEPGERGTYDITFEVTNEAGNTFHDVVVHGYTLEGERVCTASFGEVQQETVRTETTCTAFPSLLIPGAEEMNESDFADWNAWGPLSHTVDVYLGYDGRHRFETFTARRGRPNPKEIGTVLPPADSVLNAAKCTQWTRGRNLSAIGDQPWLDWERHPPNTTLRYSVRIDNHTEFADEYYVYPGRVVTPAVARHILAEQRTTGDLRTAELNETEFYEAIESVSGRNVSNPDEIPNIESHIRGNVARWNDSRVGCWANPPAYTGSSGHSIDVHARYNGAVWELSFDVQRLYRGPARVGGSSNATSASA